MCDYGAEFLLKSYTKLLLFIYYYKDTKLICETQINC
jgi:hypothetical protein